MATRAENTPLSKDDIALIKAHPELKFVHVPKKIAAHLACADVRVRSVCAVKDAQIFIEKGLSVMPQDTAVAAVSEVIKLYNTATDTDSAIATEHVMIKNELIAYQATVATKAVIIPVKEKYKVVGDILIAKQLAQVQKLVVQTDAQISGTLTVDGNLSTKNINNSIPYTKGTFPDKVFEVSAVTDATKQVRFNIKGLTKTKTTIATNPSRDRKIIVPDVDGTLLVAQPITHQVFLGGTTSALHGSNAGVQQSSRSANRAQMRLNQYGNHTGTPGITTFKSRSPILGHLAPVKSGDVLFRNTAIGVAGDLTMPASGLISINVPTSTTSVQNHIATEYELQLVSQDGPANGLRPVFKISSEGVPQLLETTSAGSHTTVPSGVATLNASGNSIVLHNKIPSNARIMLTVQPTKAPTGTMYISHITTGSSFEISSTAGAQDAGVVVYYQMYIPLS